MKAIQITETGGPEVLVLRDIEAQIDEAERAVDRQANARAVVRAASVAAATAASVSVMPTAT